MGVSSASVFAMPIILAYPMRTFDDEGVYRAYLSSLFASTIAPMRYSIRFF
jgi:hypothetical protein